MSPTIFALASAPGRAGVAVLRLSGPATEAAIRALAGSLPAPRRAARRTLTDPATGQPIDDGLVLWFPQPASFTGEDVAELHLHGGRAVLEAASVALRALGLCDAEAGEFSKRAFLNGKLDLTEAEAIADLVEAETAAQHRQALRQMQGELGRRYESWRSQLLDLAAATEAEIDFPDEDLPPDQAGLQRPAARALRDEIAAHLADARRGERLRDGIEIAVLGAPNAGKSSLINALAMRDVAIVSGTPGTTRDAIEVRMDLGGWPVQLVDTAGLRAATDEIEAEGIRRARARAAQADLKLVLFAAGQPDDPDSLALLDPDTLAVATKTDLAPAPAGRLGISVATGEGVQQLLAVLEHRVAGLLDVSGALPPTRARHRDALAQTVASLDRALVADLPELAAEDLRMAQRSLGRITGRIDVEDMLDRLFAGFCIGK